VTGLDVLERGEHIAIGANWSECVVEGQRVGVLDVIEVDACRVAVRGWYVHDDGVVIFNLPGVARACSDWFLIVGVTPPRSVGIFREFPKGCEWDQSMFKKGYQLPNIVSKSRLWVSGRSQ
jgi:hypothetical protein